MDLTAGWKHVRNVFWCWAIGSVLSAPALADEVSLNGHVFTLPDGFDIEQVAGAPLVNRPITADFDEQGRLYVADSSGSNERPDKQLQNPTHQIVRLEDTDGDGKYDKSVVYADRMMFPEGTLWYDGSLYVSAPPSIWKLTDTDGDGVADQRSEWFEGKTLTGCANDLHGPYLGLDGWIYWCKGAFAEQRYPLPPRQNASGKDVPARELVSKAAHVFRRRANGSGLVESVMTGGMDNPVDVAFMPSGERLFTTTFLQNPGGGLRDGLIHATYGGVYGKVHNVTDYHPRTGDLLPPLVHMGPAAPCGLTRYESSVFGNDYRDNLFACQFNMHKVSRHVLQPTGATFQSTDSDFVVSSNIDFHPTDVLEDADGSLIVNDTGGWYTLCCPTSQLTKPDILGAIYRVKRKGMPVVADPRGLKMNWSTPTAEDLANRLADDRQAVRSRAMQALAKLGDSAIPALEKRQKADRADVRTNAVWTLTRINHPKARAVIRDATSDRSETVRLAALSCISLMRDPQAFERLLVCLRDPSAAIQRAAAEAIGRLENEAALPDLLRAASSASTDRVLQHSLTYALIEIGQPIDLVKLGQAKPTAMLERVATIANDQMQGGSVAPSQVVNWLKSKDPILKETATWLVGRHSEWGDSLAEYLRDRVLAENLSDAERTEVAQQLAQFSGHTSIQQLLAQSAGKSAKPASRQIALEAMRQSRQKELAASWQQALTETVEQRDATLTPLAITALRSTNIKGTHDRLTTALLNVAENNQFPIGVRVDALAAIPEGNAHAAEAHFSLLADNLREEASVGTRSAAVDALLKAKLNIEPLSKLTSSIPQVGPLELNRLLGIFEQCTDEEVGLKLIAALRESPVLTSLRVDAVKTRMAKFPPSVQHQAEDLYKTINAESGRQQEKLDDLFTALADGDIRRGQVVFNSQKAACSACHAMGYIGGNIGPDLSKIGKIRSERDLLESVVFPSVSFVRSYEPVTVVTKSGKQYNGLIRKETSDEIVMATGAKEEARLLRDDIDEIRPSAVSIMPAGLETQLTRQQLADLIAFLKSRQ